MAQCTIQAQKRKIDIWGMPFRYFSVEAQPELAAEQPAERGGGYDLDRLLADPNYDPAATRPRLARTPPARVARPRPARSQSREGVQRTAPQKRKTPGKTPKPAKVPRARPYSPPPAEHRRPVQHSPPQRRPVQHSPPRGRSQAGRQLKTPRHLRDYDLGEINFGHLQMSEALLTLEAMTCDF